MDNANDVTEYLEEACFYLFESKKSLSDIAQQFKLSSDQVENAIESYKKKIDSGKLSYDLQAKEFWQKIEQESGGDERITLVDEKGRFYHGWRSEIEKLDTEQLVELLVVNKKYSDGHPLSEFSKTQPVVGYDPIIPLRNIRKTVSFIDQILQERERREANSTDGT